MKLVFWVLYIIAFGGGVLMTAAAYGSASDWQWIGTPEGITFTYGFIIALIAFGFGAVLLQLETARAVLLDRIDDRYSRLSEKIEERRRPPSADTADR